VSENENHINILIVEDYYLLRKGIQSLLNTLKLQIIIFEAENGKEAIELIERNNIDLILLDLGMPIMNGYQFLDNICLIENPPKILINSNDLHYYELRKYLAKQVVNGYMLKTASSEEFEKGISSVLSGEFFMCKDTLKFLKTLKDEYNIGLDTNKRELLTKQEIVITQLICNQYSNTMITEKLFISKNTVLNHRRNINRKLEIKNTIGLILYAYQTGMCF
jgi:DNA-binding NarL/FixJ family response regulator